MNFILRPLPVRIHEFISVSAYTSFQVHFLRIRSDQPLSKIPEDILVATAPGCILLRIARFSAGTTVANRVVSGETG